MWTVLIRASPAHVSSFMVACPIAMRNRELVQHEA